MDNVLGELFTGIAEAIRNKTGSTESIKPSDFADQIAGIHTGDGEGLSLNYLLDSFTGTREVTTVTHNLGKIPDIIVVFCSETPRSSEIVTAIGFSKNLMHAIANYDTKYPGRVNYSTANIGIVSIGTKYGFDETGDDNQAARGHIRNVTTTTFTLGSDAGNNSPMIISGKRYGYIVITGIFS